MSRWPFGDLFREVFLEAPAVVKNDLSRESLLNEFEDPAFAEKREFLPGSMWVYGPVESPTYVRFIRPIRNTGWWTVWRKEKEVIFMPEKYPDIREAKEVESVERMRSGPLLVESYFIDPLAPASAHKLNSDRTVAVATDYFWNEDMTTCPTGAKVQLLGAGGVASYGTYNGRDPFWVAWAPVPKRRTP